MDPLEFVSKAIDSLAWPAVAICVLFMFRQSLRTLLGRLLHIKGGGLEAEFEKVVERVLQEAETIKEPATTTADPNSREWQLKQLAETAPKAAILEAWREIEEAAAEACPANERFRTPTGVMRVARENRLLDENDLKRLEDIRVLRNRVAHHHGDVELSAAEAFGIAKVAHHLAEIMRSVHRLSID